MTGFVESRRSVRGDLVADCDVAVVGSGAGGLVVAALLAEAGQSVGVLEEGPHIVPQDYGRMRPSEAIRHLWREAGATFAVGVGDTPMINVMMGRCVGGSSVVTGAVSFRTPGHVLHTWREERGLRDFTEEALAPAFDAVERDMHTEEVPVSMRSQSTVLFGKGLEALGHGFKPLYRTTRGCNACSRCNFGCPHHAKMSVDLVYLPRALAHGARVYGDCLAQRIITRNGRAAGVKGRVLNGPDGAPLGHFEVRARRVVVAAGAWHSPLLLQASGVGRWKGQVGRHLTLHPSFRVMGRFDSPVRGWQGALQSAWCDAYEKEGITLMSLFVPPGVLAATMAGVGRAHVDRAAQIAHLGLFGGLIHDEGGGVVRRGPGREPFVTYRMAPKDRANVPRVLKLMTRIWFEAGAKEVFLPVLGSEGLKSPADLDRLDLDHVAGARLESASQHPLGTCRMGTSADTAVVDAWGQAFDLPGLYVADGGIVPTSLGVNPQVTIMALATRIAWHLREQPLPAAA